METEIWKDVPGYEGLYQVSNFGGVKSFKKYKSGYVMKNTNKNGWYFTIVLQGINKPKTTKRIHRIVAELFISNENNLPIVNHKDMNKQNNHYLNLEWVSIKDNVKHAVKNKPSMIKNMNRWNKYIRPKNIYQFSLSGEYVMSFSNSTEAEEITGVCQRNILQVASKDEYRPGKTRKQAGGYIWSFEDKNPLQCIK